MSNVARAVALLVQAVDTGSEAQGACSAADGHARVVRDTYASIAEASSNDAPQAANRAVLDAQEALQEASNRLHSAAEAVRSYIQDIAPGLVSGVPSNSVYRPSGTELVQYAGEGASRSERLTRALIGRLDDVADAGHKEADKMQGSAEAFRTLPRDPGPSRAVSEQRSAGTPTVSPADGGISAGTAFDVVTVGAAFTLGAKQFARRVNQWRKGLFHEPP